MPQSKNDNQMPDSTQCTILSFLKSVEYTSTIQTG